MRHQIEALGLHNHAILTEPFPLGMKNAGCEYGDLEG